MLLACINMIPLIKLTTISKLYTFDAQETYAVEAITLTINEGEFIAIMGPSGSGKTTLMQIIGALDLPTSGRYFLKGTDISSFSENELAEIRNREIGFVFQAFHLLPRRSALNNVCLPMNYAGITRDKQEIRAKDLLVKVGLGDRINFAPSQLSGGQKQRVAIARALAMKPKIILADEPTGNLSSIQGKEIMQFLSSLNNEGHTVIIVTHEEQIANYAHRQIIIRDGNIIKDTKKKS